MTYLVGDHMPEDVDNTVESIPFDETLALLRASLRDALPRGHAALGCVVAVQDVFEYSRDALEAWREWHEEKVDKDTLDTEFQDPLRTLMQLVVDWERGITTGQELIDHVRGNLSVINKTFPCQLDEVQ